MKQPIYLIPGFANDCSIYQYLVEEMNQLADFEWIKLNLPAINEIDWQQKNKNQFDESLLGSYLFFLAEKIKKESVVVASSLGAMLVMKLVEKKLSQKIKMIVAIGSNLSFIESENWQWAMAQKKFNQFKNLLYQDQKKAIQRFHNLELLGDETIKNPNQIDKLKKLLKSTKIKDSQTLKAHLFFLESLNLVNFIKSSDLKIHFIFGQNDNLVPYQSISMIEKLNPKINCELVEKSGHLPMLSQASYLAKKMQSFLDELD